MIRRQQGKLTMVSYSQEYRARLEECRHAASTGRGPYHQRDAETFSDSRADAFIRTITMQAMSRGWIWILRWTSPSVLMRLITMSCSATKRASKRT